MATKWKGWTALAGVKILCFLMIPAIVFTWMVNVYTEFAGKDMNAEVLFASFDNTNYFYSQNMWPILQYAYELQQYKSEDNILAGGCLEWRENSYGEPYLSSTVNGVERSAYDSTDKVEQEQEMIADQLLEYRNALYELYNCGGLIYYLSDGKTEIKNTDNIDREFFRSQPVYFLQDGQTTERSGNGSGSGGWYYNDLPRNATIYLAFNADAVFAQTSELLAEQQQLIFQILYSSVQLLGAVILFCILLAGAGRRRRDGGEGVHFLPLDRPWLDVSLAVLLFFEAMLLIALEQAFQAVWEYGGRTQMIVLLAVLTVGVGVPCMGWLLSLAKRMKAGSWWRHTLIYTVLKSLYRFCRTLWAGVNLTVKAVLAVLAVLVGVQIGFFAPPLMVMLFILLMVLALRFARRLYLVMTGARLASRGIYDPPIPVTGGELGDIAASITQISTGMSAAVEEQMKSERFKAELITNVSHDIRTPLTSLITYTDLLKSEGLDSEKAPEYLEVLIQKSQRLKTLTDELFEASKAATGNVEVHAQTLDLCALIRQCLGELDERVQQSGLDFRLNLPENAMVCADGKLIWRVMENLLSNVFKYAMPRSRVYMDVTREGKEVRLDMKNISEHPLNVNPGELTERFKRGDSARAGEGSGLGLSIAQSLVQIQGGRFVLSIDGDLFKATVFLPVQ